jgi:YcxB-like protein
MTIEYALTRGENVRGYFEGLLGSPRFMMMIALYALVLAIFALALTGALWRPFTIGDIELAVAIVIGFLLFLPLMLFARAKTSMRSLTISPEGISTQIGALQGQVPWQKIKIVSATDRCVLIAGSTGNAFFIPNRAFISPEQRVEFVEIIRNWINTSRTNR